MRIDSQPASPPPILEQMSALADGLRSRLLLLLEGRELTVSDLCSVLQLPQSTVSRHLKTLADGGWVRSRPDGPRRLYRAAIDRLEPTARRLWGLAREPLSATSASVQDARRLESVLARQRSRSREFFAGAAGDWDKLRDELFGQRFTLQGLIGLIDEDWTVAELGCGSGPVSRALAPWVSRVIAVDGSEAMLEAARTRLGDLDNVEVRRGELEALPIEDARLDAATLILVLHHLPDPARVLAEVARVLRAGGRLLLVDMLPHDREEYRQKMGHLWLGFSEQRIGAYLAAAGLTLNRFQVLPPEPSAKGPSLFAVSAKKEHPK